MNLKNLFMFLFFLNTVSFISVAVVLNKYQKAINVLDTAYIQQYKSLILAQELRQSSDDLTRMARTYVITGNPMYENHFKTVLDIRNGELPRPKRYNGIFWDFYTIDDKDVKLDGEKVSLRELMKRAKFKDEELNMLITSQNESDDLTKLEHIAMNAVKGIFQDENGEFTKKGNPDFKLAREIMHGNEYHEAKIRIMKPLDNFYKAFEERTQRSVNEAKETVQKLEFYVNAIVVITIILIFLSFFIILFRIIQPIDILRVAMVRLSSNDMDVSLEKNKYQDEIGDMIGAVEVFKDNTEKLISSEHQLKIAMEDAKSANRAKSSFLARMSHELRTPLNAILGFSNILQKSDNLSVEEKNNLNIIKRSGKHLLHIINEILELSKIEAGKIEIVSKEFLFEELITDIDSIFSLRCKEKGIDFKIEASKYIPKYIKLDEVRLKQVLINILGNSLKFTDKGEISLYIYEESNKLFFEIRDSGIGIEKEDLKKIFKPFEQVKNENYNKTGTGLGLAISKELVNLMEGTIYAKSEVGGGSEFFFSVSFEKASEEEILKESISKEIIGVLNIDKSQKILVVDDIEENRELLYQLLNSYGFEVFKASSGLEALDIFEKEDLSLIFMDIKMSGMDGNETIKKIREKGSLIPIITLSANVFSDDIKLTLEHGANDFLAKPFDEKELLILLEKYLNLKLKFKDEVKNEIIKNNTLDKSFYLNLSKLSLMMDNFGIEKLLNEYNINKYEKALILGFVNEFKFKELNDYCIKNIQ